MIKLGINFDEISDNLGEAIQVMQSLDVQNGELRTVQGKNAIFFDDAEAETVATQIRTAGITLVGVATPLFKWYIQPEFTEIPHDNFGFNPRADEQQKRDYIDHMLHIATVLGVDKLRIFSNLSDGTLPVSAFTQDPILSYALDKAQAAGKLLMLENEPVCIVNNKAHIREVFRTVAHPNLKLWLDIANLLELGEELDEDFMQEIAPHIEYLHVKDFVWANGKKIYRPLGQGDQDYRSIMQLVRRALGDRNVHLSIETHVFDDKRNASVDSIKFAQEQLDLH